MLQYFVEAQGPQVCLGAKICIEQKYHIFCLSKAIGVDLGPLQLCFSAKSQNSNF